MISSFIDSLKLVLSDDYDIPDSEYKKLSGILLDNGLSEKSFDTGVIQLAYLMTRYSYTFPISINFLRELWERKYVSFNFISMLATLVRDGYLKLRKVKREVYINSNTITKSSSDDLDSDIFVVVYDTDAMKSVINVLQTIVDTSEEKISEGVIGYDITTPKTVRSMLDKLDSLMKDLSISVELESFVKDDVLKTQRINTVLKDTSKYNCTDAIMQRTAKKYLSKNRQVKDIEVYQDSSDELFIGLDVDSGNLTGIADSIKDFVEDLEVNYV